MSEKMYTEDMVRGAIKHFWPMGDDDGVNRYLATLPAASAPVVPSHRELRDFLFKIKNEPGSALTLSIMREAQLLREFLLTIANRDPSLSDSVREAREKLMIQVKSTLDWYREFKFKTKREAMSALSIMTNLNLAYQALAALSTGVTPRD